jgi:hypothetical protein
MSETQIRLIVGSTALIVMIPLAITSTNAMIKRLGGKRWRALHRLAYVAAIARCDSLLHAGEGGRHASRSYLRRCWPSCSAIGWWFICARPNQPRRQLQQPNRDKTLAACRNNERTDFRCYKNNRRRRGDESHNNSEC